MIWIKERWLDGVTQAGASSVEQVVGATRYCLQAASTGGVTVTLQGALALTGQESDWDNLGSVADDSVWIEAKPVHYLRLHSNVSGGGPVSASVLAM